MNNINNRQDIRNLEARIIALEMLQETLQRKTISDAKRLEVKIGIKNLSSEIGTEVKRIEKETGQKINLVV